MITLWYSCHAGTKVVQKSSCNKKHLSGSQVTIHNVTSAKLAAVKLTSGKTTNVVSASAESAKTNTKPAVDKMEQVQIPWVINYNALEAILARVVSWEILIDIQILCDTRT